MAEYCMYLRKSRKDDDAKSTTTEETLATHERILRELAANQNLNVTHIYREVVTGDTIAGRPEMQNLLIDVERGIWAGVLVVEIERLGRGDKIDQGIIAQSFTLYNTKIITPQKTYDLENEADATYADFGMFMSRMEFNTIKRRLRVGREQAIKAGKYAANQPPYGYNRIKLTGEKGWTLEANPEEAEIVRMIFGLYTKGEKQKDGSFKRLGVSLIVRRLNKMKIPAKKGGIWVSASVRDILINPVYIGMVRWNWRPARKKKVDGKLIEERPRSKIEDCIVAKGRHEGIIDIDVFNIAQEYITQNPPRPVGERHTVKNPLSGLIICGKCGRSMVRRPYKDKNYPDTLMCAVPECPNVSVHLHYVETAILEWLGDWLREYKLEWKIDEEPKKKKAVSQLDLQCKAIEKTAKEIETLKKQLSNLHDLLEQGVYTAQKFRERESELNERIKQAEENLAAVIADVQDEELREESRRTIIPRVEHILEVYQELESAGAKNDLLKDVIDKVVYTKEKGGRWHNAPDDFELEIYPKLPKADKAHRFNISS